MYGLDCDKDTLDSLVNEHPMITPIHQDLLKWEETRDTVSKLNDLDGLVNCAAVLLPTEQAVDVSKENLDLILNVNLKAAINLMQIVGKQMILHETGGSIVYISSVGGSVAVKNTMPYCVAKAGLNMATQMFALELGPNNIRVNAVCPTAVNTEMMKGAPKSFLEQYQSKIPLGRMNEINDVVECVQFLLSDKSKMITGTMVTIDGGHTCYLPV